MIEFKVEDGDDPKDVLLHVLPPLQNLTIESIQQIEEPLLSLKPISGSIN